MTAPLWLHKPEWVSVVVTGVVGVITGGAVIWQSRIAKRAAKAAEESAAVALRQTEMQAAAMKQWVDVSVARLFWSDQENNGLEMRFEIINRTSFKLTIEELKFWVTPVGSGQRWEFSFSGPLGFTPGSGRGSAAQLLADFALGKGVLAGANLTLEVEAFLIFSPLTGAKENQFVQFQATVGYGNERDIPRRFRLQSGPVTREADA
jgi:hypothetical protein